MSEIIDNFKKVFLANFANFEGRARRSEFWLFHLVLYLLYLVFIIPVIFVLAFVIIASFNSSAMSAPAIALFVVCTVIFVAFIAFIIPIISVTARRLHDTNRSGWWMLLGLIPIGSMVVLYFLVLDGDENKNEYGADPKEEERNYYRNLASQQQPYASDQQKYVQNY